MVKRYSRSRAAQRERAAAWDARQTAHEANRDRPQYAVCSLGKARWYWVVWANYDVWHAHAQPTASGYAPDKAEAEGAAVTAGGEHQLPAGYAQAYHRRCCVAERMAQPSARADAARLQFVYEQCSTDEGRSWWQAYRIVRRTPTRVYVDDRPYRPEVQSDPDVRTFILDRVELERDGSASARSQGWWRGPYYLHPETAPIGTPPACLVALGLPATCTPADVRRAYRQRARELHPDAGGSHDAFIALTEAYTAALRLLGDALGVA